jgi:hypothetical protein
MGKTALQKQTKEVVLILRHILMAAATRKHTGTIQAV